MKLLNMTDFVLEQKETIASDDLPQADWYDIEATKLEKIRNYVQFLKQPLTLEMFISKIEKKCWEVGCGVGTGQRKCNRENCDNTWRMDTEIPICKNRTDANVLFKSFELDFKGDSITSVKYNDLYLHFDLNTMYCPPFNTVEDLCSYKLELTDSAIKQIGL